MTIPAGLLDDSAIAKLLASMTGGANMPSSSRPEPVNTGPAGLPPGGLLAPTPPFAGAQGPMNAPGAPNPGDNTHDHRDGFTGGVKHLLGVDRIQPEVAALLTPDQQQRATPGVARTLWGLVAEGKGAGDIQKERAAEMLGLTDLKKSRDTTVAIEGQRKAILSAVGPMPSDPAKAQQWTESVARLAATAPIPDKEFAETVRLTAAQLQPREFAPVRETWTTVDAMVDGKPMKVMRSNQGQLLALDGTDLRSSGARVEPMPPQVAPSFSAITGAETPEGFIPLVNTRTGAVTSTDLTARDSRGTQAKAKRENDLRTANDDMDAVDTAIQAVKDNPSALGMKNFLPTAARQRLPGRDNAQDAGTIGSLEWLAGRLRHDRFGGALTPLEAAKAARIFSEPTSPPAVTAAQLEVVKAALARKQRSLQAQVEATPGKTPAKKAPPRPAGVPDDEWAQFLKDKGYTP